MKDFAEQMSSLKNRKTVAKPGKKGEIGRVPIQGDGLNSYEVRIQQAKDALKKFETDLGWDEVKSAMVREIYYKYSSKINSLRQMKDRYSNMKVASDISIVDTLIQDVEREYRVSFNKFL